MWKFVLKNNVSDRLSGLKRVALAPIASMAMWPFGAQARDASNDLLAVLHIDPVHALWLGSLLFFITGFLAGVFTLHFLNRFLGKERE